VGACILTASGALLTILTFTLFGELRTFPVRLIMYLCACIAAGYSAFFFTSYSFVVQTWFCWPVAMVTHYFFLANFAWCLVIAFNFYQMIGMLLSSVQRSCSQFVATVTPSCLKSGTTLAVGSVLGLSS
jgi:hypothetical protein